MIYKAFIPMKLPSLNDYIRACRANKYAASKMKRENEDEIGFYLKPLPKLKKVSILFYWHEKTKRRDYDNIAFAKKFILDAMVKYGKLDDDNRNNVFGFEDRFSYGHEDYVELTIYEGE